MECGTYELPQALRDKLHAFEGKLKRLETIVTICGTGIGFLLAWLLLFLSDRLWDTPALLRLTLALGGMIAFASFANYWMRRWVFRRRDLRALAKLIQKEHRELGDRLLGIIELAGEDHPEEISPSLVRAAIRQVSRESEGLDFKAAAKSEQPRRYALTFTASVLIFGGLLAFTPAAGMNSLFRLINPTGDVDRFTFVTLDDLPDVWVVGHGEPFPFRIGMKRNSLLERFSILDPTTAKAWIGKLREPLVTTIDGDFAVFQMPSQTEESPLRITIGDAVREITVMPIRRPAIKSIQVFVSYPDYLKKSSPVRTVDGLTFSVLKDSRVTLNADLQRSLKEVSLTLNGSDATGMVQKTETGFRILDLHVTSLLNLEMDWEDTYGLKGTKSHKLRLIPMDDRSPVVTLPRLGRSSRFFEILVDEAMTIDMDGDDDHGLRNLDVEWYVSDRDGNRLNMAVIKQTIVRGAPEKSFLKGQFVFAPEMMGVPPRTVVTLYGSTRDYYPKRVPSKSPEYTFNVLSHEEHAKGIQDRFERLQTQLEESIREQEALKQRADAIKRLSEAELKDPKTAEKIKALERDQELQRKAMEELARQGSKLLREAMKNKKISGAHLQEWSKMIQNLKAISGSSMKQAQKSLGKAGQGKKNRRKEMKKAAEEMAEAVKKMQKLLKDFNKAMEELAAKNFVQRLKGLADSEKSLGGAMQQVLGESIGMTTDKLKGETRATLNRIATSSQDVRQRANELLDDLDGFFTRTRLKKYELVVKEMQKVDMLEKLDKQTKLIRNNRGMMLLQSAGYWQAKFNEWAKALGGDDDRKSKGGQGKGQQMTAEQLELLLKLMRILQQEYGLLNKTRELEKSRDFDEDYSVNAKRLADVQKRIETDLQEVLEKVPPQAKQKLEMAVNAMKDAERFLNVPDTGKQTIAAINHVIELLSQGTKSCSSSMGCTPSMMAMLMQQLGMGSGSGAGPMGGGSTAGGGIDDGKTDPGGPTSGDELDEKQDKKTAGRSLDQVPPEFREALKAYYNAIQEMDN